MTITEDPTSEVQEAARSLLPYMAMDIAGERKAEYLSLRYTGFSVREACEMTKDGNGVSLHEGSLRRWRREDADFLKLEEQAIGPNRITLRREIMHTLFVRNYYMVLKIDYSILRKAMGLVTVDVGGKKLPVPLTKEEQRYMERARAHYNPGQLEAIEKLVDPTSGGDTFNFTQFILAVAQEGPDGQNKASLAKAIQAQATLSSGEEDI